MAKTKKLFKSGLACILVFCMTLLSAVALMGADVFTITASAATSITSLSSITGSGDYVLGSDIVITSYAGGSDGGTDYYLYDQYGLTIESGWEVNLDLNGYDIIYIYTVSNGSIFNCYTLSSSNYYKTVNNNVGSQFWGLINNEGTLVVSNSGSSTSGIVTLVCSVEKNASTARKFGGKTCAIINSGTLDIGSNVTVGAYLTATNSNTSNTSHRMYMYCYGIYNVGGTLNLYGSVDVDCLTASAANGSGYGGFSYALSYGVWGGDVYLYDGSSVTVNASAIFRAVGNSNTNAHGNVVGKAYGICCPSNLATYGEVNIKATVYSGPPITASDGAWSSGFHVCEAIGILYTTDTSSGYELESYMYISANTTIYAGVNNEYYYNGANSYIYFPGYSWNTEYSSSMAVRSGTGTGYYHSTSTQLGTPGTRSFTASAIAQVGSNIVVWDVEQYTYYSYQHCSSSGSDTISGYTECTLSFSNAYYYGENAQLGNLTDTGYLYEYSVSSWLISNSDSTAALGGTKDSNGNSGSGTNAYYYMYSTMELGAPSLCAHEFYSASTDTGWFWDSSSYTGESNTAQVIIVSRAFDIDGNLISIDYGGVTSYAEIAYARIGGTNGDDSGVVDSDNTGNRIYTTGGASNSDYYELAAVWYTIYSYSDYSSAVTTDVTNTNSAFVSVTTPTANASMIYNANTGYTTTNYSRAVTAGSLMIVFFDYTQASPYYTRAIVATSGTDIDATTYQEYGETATTCTTTVTVTYTGSEIVPNTDFQVILAKTETVPNKSSACTNSIEVTSDYTQYGTMEWAYSTDDGTTWTSGLPTDAGDYVICLTVDDDYDVSDENTAYSYGCTRYFILTIEPTDIVSVTVTGSYTGTYGDMLSELTTTGVTAVGYDAEGNAISGTIAFSKPSYTPSCTETTATVVFTPSDSNHGTYTTTVAISIAQREVTVTPNDVTVVYGKSAKFSCSYDGVLASDSSVKNSWTVEYGVLTESQVQSGSTDYTTDTKSLDVGTYYIYIISHSSADNYYFTFVNPAVLYVVEPEEVTFSVTISGTVEEDETLTANIAGISSTVMAYLDYQWFLYDGSNYYEISGATSKTYTVDEDDEGYYIGVIVYFTDGAPYVLSDSAVDTILGIEGVSAITSSTVESSTFNFWTWLKSIINKLIALITGFTWNF